MATRESKLGQKKRKRGESEKKRERERRRGGSSFRTKKRWWKGQRIGVGRGRFAQRQFINHTAPYYGQTSRPRRAISSFILINNACQESGWVEQALVTETIPPPLLYDFNGVVLFPSLKARSYPAAEREREKERKKRKITQEKQRGGGRVVRPTRREPKMIKRRPSITGRVIISVGTTSQRHGNESSNLRFRRTWIIR